MKFTAAHTLVSLQKRLLFFLIPLSWLYGMGVWIRNRLYALGLFKPRTLPCRVISVGNIAVGGTGKTPAVIAIAKYLQESDMRVAILLRGYKRQSREKVTIVSDGERVCASLKESGDEAYMMAKQLTGIPVVVSRQRYEAGQVALERFSVDVLLLDDGFQHRQLARDVDILTVPAHSVPGLHAAPKNRERLLPAGRLREPTMALRRADIILLTHTDIVDDPLRPKEILKRFAPSALILESVHQPVHLYPLASFKGARRGAMSIAGKRVLAVCGIGNPDAFVRTLKACSPESVALLAFPDHYRYTETDIARLDTAFRTAQADLIVTTQKDAEKLAVMLGAVQELDLPVFVLEIALVITDDVEKLTDVLLSKH